jgi:antitoxin VapB
MVEYVAISIKDPDADRLARELSRATGESLTEAIRRSLEERLAREVRRRDRRLAAEVRRIQERVARLPVLDDRPAEAVIGYDDHGLPR